MLDRIVETDFGKTKILAETHSGWQPWNICDETLDGYTVRENGQLVQKTMNQIKFCYIN